MNDRPNHKQNLEEGFELVPQIFDEFPRMHVHFEGEERFLVFDKDKTRVVDRAADCFGIYKGSDVPEAIERFNGVDRDKFMNSYVVYVR